MRTLPLNLPSPRLRVIFFFFCYIYEIDNYPVSLPLNNRLALGKLEVTTRALTAHAALSTQVLCDMDTWGGGWTVIQRRDDIQPRQDFYLTWMEYALGFGNLNGEFWLGLDHIHALTDQAYNEILFNLNDFEGEWRHAHYRFFYVHDRVSSFLMEVNGYSGDAGDSFTYHHGHYFSTKDRDLDDSTQDCAEEYSGAWWYGNCHRSNLNGLYLSGRHESYADGVEWAAWHGMNYSLKLTEMKIRPAYE